MSLLGITTKQDDVTCLPVSQAHNEFSLVAGIKSGDINAAAAFFDKYNDQVNKLVWKMLGDDPEHNDVVNNAFSDMLSSIGSIKDPQALQRWVSVVTLNAVRRELRSRKYRNMFTPLSDATDDFATESKSHADNLSSRIFNVVNTMSPNNHIVFVLRFIEGHTFEEIARINKCSLATAKRHGKKSRMEFMKKARKDLMLRNLVERCEND